MKTKTLVSIVFVASLVGGFAGDLAFDAASRLRNHLHDHIRPLTQAVYPIDQITFERGATRVGGNSQIQHLEFDAPAMDGYPAAKHKYPYPGSQTQAAAEAVSVLALVPGAEWDVGVTGRKDQVQVGWKTNVTVAKGLSWRKPTLVSYSKNPMSGLHVVVVGGGAITATFPKGEYPVAFAAQGQAREFVTALSSVSRWADPRVTFGTDTTGHGVVLSVELP